MPFAKIIRVKAATSSKPSNLLAKDLRVSVIGVLAKRVVLVTIQLS